MTDIRADLNDCFADAASDAPIVASVTTPYQLMFLERLVAVLAPRPMLLIDQRPAKFRDGRAPRLGDAKIISLTIDGNVMQPENLARIRDAMARIEAMVGDRPFTFLCASLAWPFNNMVYTRWRRRPGVRIALSEDGLSTYLRSGQSGNWMLRSIALELIGRVRGAPARTLFSGHPLGLDQPDVRTIFVGSDRVVPTDGGDRYRVVPPDARLAQAGSRDPARAVFVGQPYLRDYGAPRMAAFVDHALGWLRGQGVSTIHIKPHHFQSPEEIALYTDRSCILVDPPVPIEEMIGDSDYGVIASANSTALMTVKSMLGDTIRSVAFDPAAFRQIQERRDPADILAVFRKFGVEVIEA
ncbi:hypothetical protein ACPVPU_11170 [Sphingomonas sp. CJ99]